MSEHLDTIHAWIGDADVGDREDEDLVREFNRQHQKSGPQVRAADFKVWRLQHRPTESNESEETKEPAKKARAKL